MRGSIRTIWYALILWTVQYPRTYAIVHRVHWTKVDIKLNFIVPDWNFSRYDLNVDSNISLDFEQSWNIQPSHESHVLSSPLQDAANSRFSFWTIVCVSITFWEVANCGFSPINSEYYIDPGSLNLQSDVVKTWIVMSFHCAPFIRTWFVIVFRISIINEIFSYGHCA